MVVAQGGALINELPRRTGVSFRRYIRRRVLLENRDPQVSST